MAWKVGDVMTREVVTVGPELDFKGCVDLLRVHAVSALPVVDGDFRLLGIISEADLLLKEERRDSRDHLRSRQKRKAIARTAGDVMSKPVWSVGQSASLAEAARLMHNRAVKRLPVVDAGGRLVGIVSRVDLLKPFLRSDESIRREIAEDLLKKTLWIDQETVDVSVQDGVVRLAGELETKSLVELVFRLAEAIEGVVGVDNRLGHRLDDTHMSPDLPPLALQLSARERGK
jgi:CBS-domain-containing membrane protein